jgi:hypothetical protein
MARPAAHNNPLDKVFALTEKQGKKPLERMIKYLQIFFRLNQSELVEPTHFKALADDINDPYAVTEAVFVEFNKYLHQSYINLIIKSFVEHSLDRLFMLAPQIRELKGPIKSTELRKTTITSVDYPLSNLNPEFFTDESISRKLYRACSIDPAFKVPEKAAEYLKLNTDNLLDLVQEEGFLNIDISSLDDEISLQMLKLDPTSIDKMPLSVISAPKVIEKYVKNPYALKNFYSDNHANEDQPAQYSFLMDLSEKNRRVPLLINMIGKSVTLKEILIYKQKALPVKNKYLLSSNEDIDQEWLYGKIIDLVSEPAFTDLSWCYETLQKLSK